MQHFFSDAKVSSGYIYIDENAFKVSLSFVNNDLVDYFELHTFPNNTDLTSRYNKFYNSKEQNDPNNSVYYNMYCPFWYGEGNPSEFKVEFNLKMNTADDQALVNDSQTAFNGYVSQNTVILMVTLEAMFAANAHLPDGNVKNESEIKGSDILEVPPVESF